MPLFNYKAQKATGEIYEGSREAADKFALAHDLKKDGDTIIGAHEAEKKSGGQSLQGLLNIFSRVSMHEKIVFMRNLGNMLEAGLAMSRALSVLERQGKNKKMRTTVAALNEEIKKGNSLSASMKVFPSIFPPLVVSMIKTGEESGNMASSLKSIANQLDKTYTLKKKIKGAMIYPAIILGVMGIIGVLMMIYVVPTLTATFKELNVALPFSTQMVMLVSDFMRDHTVVALLVIISIVLCFYFISKTKRGSRCIDWIVLHIPLVSTLVKETNTARTARTISSLVTAGVDLVEGLRITGDVLQNSYYKSILKEAEEVIQKGKPISSVFAAHEKLYPPLLGEMVSVGEETGKLGEMFNNVASYYENEVEQKTKDMSTIIEPFLMVFIGAVVGFFAIAMISPIYSVFDTI
jgi:type IV pilus assembly protein PilC